MGRVTGTSAISTVKRKGLLSNGKKLTGTDRSVPGRAEGAAAEGEGKSRWKNGADPMTEWTNVDEGVVVKPG